MEDDQRRMSTGKSESSDVVAAELEENAERQKWSGQIEFILTVVGYAVGLGNIWRFPYLCYQHGGGTFLIPYLILLSIVGLPLFFFELCLGQFASLGPIKVWKLTPIFQGVGFAACSVIWMNSFVQNIVLAWGWYYLFASFTSVLPWTYCDNDWNTPACMEGPDMKELQLNGTFDQWLSDHNLTREGIKTPSEEYFYREVLKMSDGFDNPGKPVWQLVLCLMLSWGLCFLALIKGIDSLGKVMYVVTTLPYIMMTALVIRGATLDGAREGVEAYLSPDFAQLADAQMWSNAATQTFYTLGACSGGLIAMSSYNVFRNNLLRDSLIVPAINALTSLYAGFAIFSVLGFMAHLKGVDISDVAADGPGLVFVVYPEALSQMPAPPVWSVLFFLMLIMLGYSSVFSMTETVFIAVMDSFPSVFRGSKWRPIIFRGVCVSIYFLLTMAMVTNGGFYIFDVTDAFVSGFPMLIVGFTQITAVAWVYGYNRFAGDIGMMLGKRPSVFFRICWVVLSPAILLTLIIVKAIQYTPKKFEDYLYPDVANAVGWLEVAFIVGWIPLVAFIRIVKHAKIHLVIRDLARPKASWGPAKPEDRTGIYGPDLGEYDQDYSNLKKRNHVDSVYSVTHVVNHSHQNEAYDVSEYL